MDAERKKKLDELITAGIAPYPYSFNRTHYAKQIIDDYDKLEGKNVRIAGRVMQKRSFGKLVFAHVQDVSGKLQVFAQADKAGKFFDLLNKFVEAGDFIGGEGVVAKTKKGEKSVGLSEIVLLAKSLRNPPEKFHGLQDTEARYRKRYLDLIMNPGIKNVFETRAKIISLIRKFLDDKGFIEVETPVLQQLYGGAAAKPFTTTHNALNTSLYLRIADELYLKRLIIGGMERVYEIGKNFRNEDIDSTHNPEFTMIEWYQAYADYNELMKEIEELLPSLAKQVNGSLKIDYQSKTLDFTPPYKKISLVKEIMKETSVDVTKFSDEEASKTVEKLELEVKIPTRSHVVDALFDKFVLPKLWNPTFVIDYPEYMCPLTKKKRGEPELSERFELFIAGQECGNCYSELTNPVEQRTKFEEQRQALKKGDEEAHPLDEDFLEAMEYGMPPTGGIGLGIDRLAMLFTDNVSIKEVILFPSMKPLKEKEKTK